MINLIVAVDKFYGISKNSCIPWKFKEDMKWFKNKTISNKPGKQNVVIMGKTTFLNTSVLMDRIILVVSKTLSGTNVFLSLSDAMDYAKCLSNVDKIFLVGGKQIYEEGVKYCDNIYITHINENYNCDNFLSENFSEHLRKIYTVKYDGFEIVKYKRCGEYLYLNLLKELLMIDELRDVRNGYAISMFDKSITFNDVQKHFPLLTTKRVFFRGMFEELMFFISGKTNTNVLSNKGIKIWEGNTRLDFLRKMGLNYEEGDMGPMYGFQLRHFGYEYKGANYDYSGCGFDQLEYVIDTIRKDPNSRRLIMSVFNPAMAGQGVLYPCHSIVIQLYVDSMKKISCAMYQRSADSFLGLPFNIASISLFLILIVNVLGDCYSVGNVTVNLGDVHLYKEHIECAKEQLKRCPYKFPELKFLNRHDNIDDYVFDDIELCNYVCHPKIIAKMII